MSSKETLSIFEIDVDYCSLNYGTGACGAVLGTSGDAKCFNTDFTCQSRDDLDLGVKTLRFAEPSTKLPKGVTYFPVITKVSSFSNTVNIAGTDPDLASLGRNSTISVSVDDFPYDDVLTDKYAGERITGAAQANATGYNPVDHGTFFPRLRARWPYFAGRNARHIQHSLVDGEIVDTATRHCILTEFDGADGKWKFEAKDIFYFFADDKAQAPKPSRGYLAYDIDESNNLYVTLEPVGVASDYDNNGYVCIGSEIMRYVLSGDQIRIRERGVGGTEVSSHSENDTVQQVLNIDKMRIDEVAKMLIEDYTDAPSGIVPTDDWEAEITRWMGGVFLSRYIVKPTGVAKLLNGLSVLGVSIWPDDLDQEVKMKAARPVDGDVVHNITDNNLVSIKREGRDDKRLTQVHIYSHQINQTLDEDTKSNYKVHYIAIDQDNETRHGSAKIREIYCPWFNEGNYQETRIIARRILSRFTNAPERYTLRLDADDGDISLTDVISLTSDAVQTVSGRSSTKTLQTTRRYEPILGHEIEILAQAYEFDGRYGYIMADDANDYDSATETEKAEGAYISEDDGSPFDDGTEPYEII